MRGRAARAPAAPEAVIVGAGLMGRWHADAVRRAGHRVAAVVDVVPGRARALAARHPGARAADTLAGGLEPGRVVHVCTPLACHAEHTGAALEAGCHVVVEKPLAPSGDETAALLARAASRGVLLVPVHQYLFQPGVARACDSLGGLGRVLHVDAVVCTAGAEGCDDAGRDRVALEVLPHPLSLVARLLDPNVDAVAWQAARPRAGELRVAGVLGAVSVAMLVSTRGRPTRHELRLVCEGGTVLLDLFHGYAVTLRGAPTRASKLAQPFLSAGRTLAAAGSNLAARAARRETAYHVLREMARRAYAAAVCGGPAPVSARETLAVARALDLVAAALSPGAGRPRGAPAHVGA